MGRKFQQLVRLECAQALIPHAHAYNKAWELLMGGPQPSLEGGDNVLVQTADARSESQLISLQVFVDGFVRGWVAARHENQKED